MKDKRDAVALVAMLMDKLCGQSDIDVMDVLDAYPEVREPIDTIYPQVSDNE